jgi:hypothetical protein
MDMRHWMTIRGARLRHPCVSHHGRMPLPIVSIAQRCSNLKVHFVALVRPSYTERASCPAAANTRRGLLPATLCASPRGHHSRPRQAMQFNQSFYDRFKKTVTTLCLVWYWVAMVRVVVAMSRAHRTMALDKTVVTIAGREFG